MRYVRKVVPAPHWPPAERTTSRVLSVKAQSGRTTWSRLFPPFSFGVWFPRPNTASVIMVHLRAFTKFLFKRYKATVIDDIWPELFFFTGVAVSELHF